MARPIRTSGRSSPRSRRRRSTTAGSGSSSPTSSPTSSSTRPSATRTTTHPAGSTRASRCTSRRATREAIGRPSSWPSRPGRSSRSRGSSGQFPTTAAQFRAGLRREHVSRSTSSSASTAGRRWWQLVRSYADGVTDDEAFSAALGLDVAGFEAAWLDSLGAAAPSPYGPVDAPPGPVPSDWLGEGELPGVIPTGSPSASAPPANPGQGSDGDATALLVGLLIAGAAVAGVGVWLARRNRPAVATVAASQPSRPPAADVAVPAGSTLRRGRSGPGAGRAAPRSTAPPPAGPRTSTADEDPRP